MFLFHRWGSQFILQPVILSHGVRFRTEITSISIRAFRRWRLRNRVYRLVQSTKMDLQIWEDFLPMAPEDKSEILGKDKSSRELHARNDLSLRRVARCRAAELQSCRAAMHRARRMTVGTHQRDDHTGWYHSKFVSGVCLLVFSFLPQVSTVSAHQTFPIFAHFSYFPEINVI